MGWLGRGLGSFGAQAGEASEINQDFRAKQQEMALKAAQQKLQELLLPLQIAEMQARIKQMGMPKTQTVGLPGGGTGLFSLSPTGEPSDVKTLVPGEKPSLKQRYEDETDPAKKKQLLSEMGEESEATAKRTPLQLAQENLMAALASGNPQAIAGAQKNLATLVSTSKAPSAPTMTGLWWAAQHGDKDAQSTLKSIESYNDRLLMARGEGYARARAQYQFQPYVDDTGQIVAINGVDAKRLYDSGQKLTPVSRISAKDANAFQQFNAESAPAIADVRRWAKAYDNPQDQAIFAGIMANADPYLLAERSAG